MKKFRALILSTVMAILAFVGLTTIGHAAENDDNLIITDIKTSTNKVENGGKFRIDVSFKGTSEVKPGDKLVIPLPKSEHGYLQTDMQFSKPFDATYEGKTIKDVGTMSVEGDQMVLTFNDNVTQLENGFYGTAYFEVVAIITSNGSGNENGPITIPGSTVVLPGGATFPDITVEPGNTDDGLKMTKTGQYTADGKLEWTVGVDVSRELLDKAGKDGYLVITDKLGYDLPIDWDTLQVKAGWMFINEEMMYLTKDADNKGFTIRIPYSFLDYAFNVNDVDPLHVTITYQSGDMEDLVDGMTYDNVANASLGGANASANADYTYHIAGSGGMEGDSSSTEESTTTTESVVSSDVEESTTDSTTDVASSDLPTTTTTSTTDAEESTSTDGSTTDSSTSTTEVTSSDLPTTTTSTSADIELPVVSDSSESSDSTTDTTTSAEVSDSTSESTTDTTSSTVIDSSTVESTTESTTVDTTSSSTVPTIDDNIKLPINKVTSESSSDTDSTSTTSTSTEEDSEDPEDPNKEDSTGSNDVTTDEEVSDEEAAVIVTDKKVDTTTKKVDSTTKSNNKNDQDLPQTGTEQSVLLVVMGMGCILLGGYLLKKRN